MPRARFEGLQPAAGLQRTWRQAMAGVLVYASANAAAAANSHAPGRPPSFLNRTPASHTSTNNESEFALAHIAPRAFPLAALCWGSVPIPVLPSHAPAA